MDKIILQSTFSILEKLDIFGYKFHHADFFQKTRRKQSPTPEASKDTHTHGQNFGGIADPSDNNSGPGRDGKNRSLSKIGLEYM